MAANDLCHFRLGERRIRQQPSHAPSGVPRREQRARGIVRAGYLCGAAFVAASAIRGCVHGEDWRADLFWTAVFGGSALLLLWAWVAGNPGAAALEPPGEIAGETSPPAWRGRSLRGDRPDISTMLLRR